ncbi:unnamed protein product [Parnassius apollo]|uniref:(apollo) hypothetical protein n=1 Tax=Parnassius apollo TaxID=110799 RepID=A0A8S3Y7R1_PARAO|nr:unnamed protein product [Parnassius apollo]
MNIPSIENCDLHNKTVLLRVDFNVPIKDGEILDVTRILRALPTIEYLVNASAKIIIISHFGCLKARDNNLSLKNVVDTLSQLLNKKVKFIDDCVGEKVQKAVSAMDARDIILLENLRFYKEEQLASLADIYM